jgi:peptidoglycan/LPS O-acetylase OafA/YrhL
MGESSYPKMYFKNLDATRFLSCLTVFLHHTIITGSTGTSSSSLYRFYDTNLSLDFIMGLDYYVVLSGFLISWVILEEYKSTTRFNIGYYYLRRILRTCHQ